MTQFEIDNRIYTIKDIDYVLSQIGDIDTVTRRGYKDRKKILYYNISAAFDIETSSWYEGDDKCAAMYIWQFGIHGHVIVGRTWRELKILLNKLTNLLELSEEKRLVVYVQNLSYEYQFLKDRYKFTESFEIDLRKVIKATTQGIEFRCSCALSGKKLELMGKELIRYKVEKKVGQLNYDLVRHSKTPLTDEEMEYCVNDVQVVMSYIQEKIDTDGSIEKIPLTSTGYVRKMCKDSCYARGDKRTNYNSFIKNLTLTEELYAMCKDAFRGGYVHCNPIYSGDKLRDVASYDFTTSYIAQAVAKKCFPMSSGRKRENVTKKEFYEYLQRFCCIFDITITNLRLKDGQYAAPLSASTCDGKMEKLDNGRIMYGSEVITTLTEQDWETIEMFYDFDDFRIDSMYTFIPGRLPKELIVVMLSLYSEKTKYKGVEDKEEEYLFAKSNLNSIYGMMVTDVYKQYKSLDDYNKSFSRFLYYPWGVWISALARNALFSGIYEAGEDFVYADTDSIKITNYKKHKEYIEDYNCYIKDKIIEALDYYELDHSLAFPSDINGEVRPLGIWTFEGVSEEFKAIRAKAYIYKQDGEYKLTLAGVSKTVGIEYLKELGDPIKNFTRTLIFPAGRTGKLTHTYIDEKRSGEVLDYLGVSCKYEELSYIHMEPCGYDMNEENEYLEFLDFLSGIIKK